MSAMVVVQEECSNNYTYEQYTCEEYSSHVRDDRLDLFFDEWCIEHDPFIRCCFYITSVLSKERFHAFSKEKLEDTILRPSEKLVDILYNFDREELIKLLPKTLACLTRLELVNSYDGKFWFNHVDQNNPIHRLKEIREIYRC